MPFFLYILQSESTGAYHVGATQHVEARVRDRNSSSTLLLKNRGPWKLVYSETHPTRGAAVRRGNFILKQKDRRFIEDLVKDYRESQSRSGLAPNS
jgi:putative endonuclease